ncbi:MAG TPA: 30S ribosomal protein S3 [Phycisphaerae bacterium]|nr:30S ribosomal protein S3 [Phycisphaerae bacterium]HOI56491.1 30S ribosomal protein S3 [Phycisphaerae bacterium]
MGQKINPIGFRTGIVEDWKSRWYAGKKIFGDLLIEDSRIRKFVKDNYRYAGIPRVEIERTREEVKVVLHTARPGLIIGRKGAEVDKLREQLEELTGRRVAVSIQEIKNPDTSALLVGEAIADALLKRQAFRRVMRMRAESVMQSGALGVKIQLSGRLGGAEMSRCEKQSMGSIPLQTLQSNIDYALTEAYTTYGAIGIKVWIYKGQYEEGAADGHDA